MSLEHMWQPDAAHAVIYQNARSEFAAYAACAADDPPGPTVRALQIKLARWQVKNFGCVPDCQIALGIAEEYGELQCALGVLEIDQSADLLPEVSDAVADMFVYAANLCTSLRLDMFTLAADDVELSAYMTPTRRTAAAVGRLAHITLKSAQKIRGYEDQEKVRVDAAFALRVLFRSTAFWVRNQRSIEAFEAFERVALDVLKRDWTKGKAPA